MQIRRIEPADRAALEGFLARIPDADRTFLKEDVADPAVVSAWARPGDSRSNGIQAGRARQVTMGSVTMSDKRRLLESHPGGSVGSGPDG